jgi:hypothetical protein
VVVLADPPSSPHAAAMSMTLTATAVIESR